MAALSRKCALMSAFLQNPCKAALMHPPELQSSSPSTERAAASLSQDDTKGQPNDQSNSYYLLNQPARRHCLESPAMASLPSAHPTLSLHLTDPALTPLISSSSSSYSQPRRHSTSSSPSLPPISHSPRFAALTDLTTAALTAYSSTARLGLGLPLRIIIDTTKSGPVILHSFLNPEIMQPVAKAQGSASSITADANAIVDQTREQLRPLSASTVDEEAQGLNEGVAGDWKVCEGTFGPGGEESDVTVAVNGQPVTDGAVDTGNGTLLDEVNTEEDVAPLLIASVAAPSHDKEASKAMSRLERLAVEFQKRWVEQQTAEREAAEAAEREQVEEENADG